MKDGCIMNQIDLQKLKKMSRQVKEKKIPLNLPVGKTGCSKCTKKFTR
jgi:hypothetical protein